MYGDLCVTLGGVLVAGSSLVIEDCAGTVEQQWDLNDDGTISAVGAPELCLATREDSWGLSLATCEAGATTQLWCHSASRDGRFTPGSVR
ncbi:ricin-type beta-trefoil lectin domain protein [Myceligenerans indicum]|uniref:Ricin-type beta-trefoil lectin domain protein n=1 Tax=Myceligenerans indicum TaxID=2593663 RepID=A0ABS1LJV1_9MICO|nr:ricin-type beta-trefoil lectin domain protein [Myceligenerans indicum]MBL0886408.1 ricin-type beta-trefoil lectin domain protein [Myceligenerans indicum]